jgi:betaine-aldehyde dehydrogenase
MNERNATQSDTAGVILPTKTDLYYGGRWHEALSKRRVDVTSPATQEKNSHINLRRGRDPQ